MSFKNNQILLCCGKKGCPILSKQKNGMIQIKDDHGSSILIKEEEARLIHGALNKLSKR